MTKDDKHLIRESWAHVVPIADTAASLFYDRLFAIDPSVRPLFATTDMAAQRTKLVQALNYVVESLDDLGGILDALRDLGRRHSGYGVTAAHYASVGAAFLWTLEAGLGDAGHDHIVEPAGRLLAPSRQAKPQFAVAVGERQSA